MRRLTNLLFLLTVAVVGYGCSSVSVLPESKKTSGLPWLEFKEMNAAYEMIEPGKTNRLQSNAIGFKPERFSGVQRLDYFQTRKLIQGDNSQNFKLEDLPAGLKECYRIADRCRAVIYRADPKTSQEVGNILANKTDLKITTVTSGWMLTATIFIGMEKADIESDNDIVLFKSKSDTPIINEIEVRKDPMGPLKTLGGMLVGAARKMLCFGLC